MQSLALHGARERLRTLAVRRDAIWMWPGIPLTLRRGTEIVPIADEVINFWITRLHGPDALYTDCLSTVSRAARVLTMGDAVKAQHILDTLKLTALSADGAALMKVLAGELGITAMNLPTLSGPRTWNARDIALHCSLFKEHVDAARLLAKGGACPWDEEKHPRWPAGAPESQGGRFAPSVGSGGTSLSVAPQNEDDNEGSPSGKPPLAPNEEPPPGDRYETIKAIGRWMAAKVVEGEIENVKLLLGTVKLISWVRDAPYRYYDQLVANLEEPKSFEELQEGLGHPRWGYHEHHIAERASATQDKFPESLIESPDNRVMIPAMKHREITTWYQTPNKDYEWLSPREYLRGKSWNERYSLGIQKLIDFGVLKQ
jgi:hypothetical protein